eukprot:TCONS_00034832-protein
MDFNLVPNELLKKIFSYLTTRDAKNISLMSKRMYSLSLERIWSKPTFMLGIMDVNFLKEISNLPIVELCTHDFYCPLNEFIKTIPRLKCLNVNSYIVQHTLEELKGVKIPLNPIIIRLFRILYSQGGVFSTSLA